MAVSMIKIRSHLKDNLRMDRLFQQHRRDPHPLPHAHPQSFATAKRSIDYLQQRTSVLYANQMVEDAEGFDLECTETLQPVLRPPLNCKSIHTEADLLCEEELIEQKDSWPTPRLLARVQEVLKTYQCEIGQLHRQKDDLEQENSRLREQVATLMSYFRK